MSAPVRSWRYGDPPPFEVEQLRDRLGFFWWFECPPDDLNSDLLWTDGEERLSWLALARDRGPLHEPDASELP